MIAKIQRFSLHDGPGVRTTVFFKGCPLRCVWCSNPETYDFSPRILYDRARCIGCHICNSVCPRKASHPDGNYIWIDRTLCNAKGGCTRACPTGAVSIVGKEMTPGEILAEVLKDRPFYAQGGGATFSGGEPLSQSDLLFESARLLKENGVSSLLDTCGYAEKKLVARVPEFFDAVYFDLKHMNSKVHEGLTGVKNELILENCRFLCASKLPVTLRFPLIPGLNDGEENIDAMIGFLSSLPAYEALSILPYHSLGTQKYKQLGLSYAPPDIAAPTAKDLETILARFQAAGIKTRLS